MPGLINSGWDLTGFGSMAVTVDVGAAVGGGRFTLDIKDQNRNARKLAYWGASLGVGVGVHGSSDALLTAAERAAQAGFRFVLNIILPMLRMAANSQDLPSRQSRIFLKEGFSTPAPLSWNGDFLNKSLLMITVGAGLGFGLSGTLILFFPSRVTWGQFAPIEAIENARAIAFSGGMQMGQVGADIVGTPCMHVG